MSSYTKCASAAFLALVAVIVLTATMANGAPHHSATSSRKCFPASKWNYQERVRPCVAIARIYEDGSFQFVVTDADGTVRYSSGVGALDR